MLTNGDSSFTDLTLNSHKSDSAKFYLKKNHALMGEVSHYNPPFHQNTTRTTQKFLRKFEDIGEISWKIRTEMVQISSEKLFLESFGGVIRVDIPNSQHILLTE